MSHFILWWRHKHSLKSFLTVSCMLYNRNFRENFRFKFSRDARKRTTEEVYQDVKEVFCIIRSSFVMSIFTHYWQNWFFDVSLYHHEMQNRLRLIYLDFIFMLHYGQRITQVCFSSISMDSDYHNAAFVYIYGQRITP